MVDPSSDSMLGLVGTVFSFLAVIEYVLFDEERLFDRKVAAFPVFPDPVIEDGRTLVDDCRTAGFRLTCG